MDIQVADRFERQIDDRFAGAGFGKRAGRRLSRLAVLLAAESGAGAEANQQCPRRRGARNLEQQQRVAELAREIAVLAKRLQSPFDVRVDLTGSGSEITVFIDADDGAFAAIAHLGVDEGGKLHFSYLRESLRASAVRKSASLLDNPQGSKLDDNEMDD